MNSISPLDFLGQYKWKKRILLLFSSHVQHHLFLEQLNELKCHALQFKERNTKIFSCVEDGFVVRSLKTHFDIKTDFGLVLLGRDAKVKRTSDKVLKASEIFQIIDNMPLIS